MDFYAAIMYALQAANWQRSGGQGSQPEPVSRPEEDHEKDAGPGFTVEQLEARKKAFREQMQRAREHRNGGE
jgi:hypothetical protein